MRILQSVWSSGIAVALAMVGLSLLPLQAEEAPPSDWSIQGTSWRSKALSVGEVFQLRMDGRTFTPVPNSKSSTPPADNSPAPPGKGKDEPGPSINFLFEGKPVGVKRSLTLDRTRQAIRVLDVFENSGTTERHVRLDYFTNVGERGGVRYNGILLPDGTAREYGQAVPDDNPGVIVLAEREGSDAVPLFLWGKADAKWHPQVRDVGSSVNLTYEGDIPAGGKVALLHWIATAGLERGVRLEQSFERFYKNGRLVQPLVPADIVPLVANFPAGAFQQEPAAAASTAPVQPARKLVVLDDLCAKLRLKRDAKDALVVGADQPLIGEATVEKISIQSRGKALDVPAADVAAISGGAGIGRLHHLYLRDGTVLAGQVTLTGGKIETPGGSITLTGDALDVLLLRVQPKDGELPAGSAGFAQTQQGEFFWLAKLPETLELATSIGGFKLPLENLWLVERKPDPPVSLTVTLNDGGRIQGVVLQPTFTWEVQGRGPLNFANGELVRWGRVDAAENKSSDADPAKFGNHHCALRDGSLLEGTPAVESLHITTPTGQVTAVKVSEVIRMDSRQTNEAAFELAGGTQIKGALLDETLPWTHHGQTLSIPMNWLTEFVKRDPPPPSASASTDAPKP